MYFLWCLRGEYRFINVFFIWHFYAIMHRRTIVQNWIINIICSCIFCQANINLPNLVNVCLGSPNPNAIYWQNFHPRRIKKCHSTPNCMDYDIMLRYFQFWFDFFSSIFKKNQKISLYVKLIYLNFLFLKVSLCNLIVKSLLMPMQFISSHCDF